MILLGALFHPMHSLTTASCQTLKERVGIPRRAVPPSAVDSVLYEMLIYRQAYSIRSSDAILAVNVFPISDNLINTTRRPMKFPPFCVRLFKGLYTCDTSVLSDWHPCALLSSAVWLNWFAIKCWFIIQMVEKIPLLLVVCRRFILVGRSPYFFFLAFSLSTHAFTFKHCVPDKAPSYSVL